MALCTCTLSWRKRATLPTPPMRITIAWRRSMQRDVSIEACRRVVCDDRPESVVDQIVFFFSGEGEGGGAAICWCCVNVKLEERVWTMYGTVLLLNGTVEPVKLQFFGPCFSPLPPPPPLLSLSPSLFLSLHVSLQSLVFIHNSLALSFDSLIVSKHPVNNCDVFALFFLFFEPKRSPSSWCIC